MKREPGLAGKAPLILRQQAEGKRTSRKTLAVYYDSLTTPLQVQIFGDVSEDITAAVVSYQHVASDWAGAAGNSCEG
jgi:hypothetical protein